jgi:threonine dehydratase
VISTAIARLPVFEDILDAGARLQGQAVRTPLLRADALDRACGGRVFVKAEALQRTGSFKFRGAYNRISRLTPEERVRGVVAFSSGNHAQGVAAAAGLVGCPAVIVMPADAPASKIAATRTFGAEVVLYDRYTESREAIAAGIAAERGSVTVPPFDDPFVIAGQGTAGLEAARQLAEIDVEADVLLAPASGGGLIAGIALAFERLSPRTRIYTAEPAGFDDHARSLAAGTRQKNGPDGRSLCDALLAPQPGEITFQINGRLLAGGVSVTDEQALAAMAFAFRHLKVVIEPGGATALAALLSGALKLDGRTAVAVASGGNVDAEIYARALDL